MLDILISATERACHVLLLPPLLLLLLLLLLVPCALLLLADLALPGSFVVVLAGLCSCCSSADPVAAAAVADAVDVDVADADVVAVAADAGTPLGGRPLRRFVGGGCGSTS